jgi:hypothetical protein
MEPRGSVLLGVAEADLAADHRLVVGLHAGAVGQGGELEQAGMQPFAVGFGLGEVRLDLVVGDDAAGRSVDEEHLAGLQAALGDDLGRRHVQDTALAGEDDTVVEGPPPSAGA